MYVVIAYLVNEQFLEATFQVYTNKYFHAHFWVKFPILLLTLSPYGHLTSTAGCGT
jgi:hypothetical protein